MECMELTSCQETDSTAHLARLKQHHICSKSQFKQHSPKAFNHRFQKQYTHVLCLHNSDAWTSRRPVYGVFAHGC